MGVKLFLIRHGQTLWNLEGRYQGDRDIELTELGIRQAELAAGYLQNVDYSNIYCSPLKRTAATAEIINAKKNREIIVRQDLKEINFGKWEGLTFQKINQDYFEDYQAWLDDPFSNAPTGGEDFSHFVSRTSEEINRILAENQDGSDVIICTHGGVIVALLVWWLRVPKDRWRSLIQRQGAINVVVVHKGFPYISQVNYTGHLNGAYRHDEDKVI
ncbi:MAG: histidine phosphatase family protein [Actinomycetota bacterium]|nr:histidine phosphatase family protein [Actinomycetota bacterium]